MTDLPQPVGTADAELTEAALAACADEPIRIPGAIQPHGVLLAVREPDLTVAVASANAADLFGREVDGVGLADLLDEVDLAALREGLTGDLAELDPLAVRVGGGHVDLVAHRADGLLVTEWEPVAGARQAGAAWHHRLPRVLARMTATETLDQLTRVLADDVRELTGFDRVMVYRFDPEWNGEVVAEARREDLEPFLGLHFPASDIPAQARALYTTNWLRIIPDARYAPVPLQPGRSPVDGEPLDLSGSVLRSVSPVHLQYLANMGVASSMSVSLIDEGRLWGLVACHHYSGPHRPSYADRVTAEFLGRTASLLLAAKAGEEVAERVLQVAEREAALVAALGRSRRTPLGALTAGPVTALDLLPAGGAAVRIGGHLSLLGDTPPAGRVVELVEALRASGTQATDSLVRVVPDATDVVDVASGVLAVETGTGRADFLAWFRPEVLREVTWGGDPHEAKVVDDVGGAPRLSPRRSFAGWRETVRTTATPWQPHEVAAAGRLARHVGEMALRQAEEDNQLVRTLQRVLLLEQLPTVPGVALAARYAAAADDVVGGDWYDLVLLPSGKVAVVLGDVAGHGLSAAAVTGQLRHALRANLLRDAGPGAALEALNQLITSLLPGEMATAVVAELDPATGVVTTATAGHLPALALASTGNTFVDGARGPALGVIEDVTYAEARWRLVDDDRLLLYSDGLVERRHVDLQESLERLRSAARRGPDLDGVLDDLIASFAPPDTDDVTVVGIGLDRSGAAPA